MRATLPSRSAKNATMVNLERTTAVRGDSSLWQSVLTARESLRQSRRPPAAGRRVPATVRGRPTAGTAAATASVEQAPIPTCAARRHARPLRCRQSSAAVPPDARPRFRSRCFEGRSFLREPHRSAKFGEERLQRHVGFAGRGHRGEVLRTISADLRFVALHRSRSAASASAVR